MLNKLYSTIGNFCLRRTDAYLQNHNNEDGPTSTTLLGYPSNAGATMKRNHNNNNTPNTEPSYNIRIYSAKGGRVIECHSNTSHNHQDNTDLYVIPDGTDLVDELGKILMMHSLTR